MAATLEAIQTKVRRLTRSPSSAQLTDDQLNEYINTFVLYDFPEELRLFALRETFTFYTTPNIDVYETNTVNSDDPLYNFKNKYITVHSPVYIAGFPAYYSQSRSEFFTIFPFNNSIVQFSSTGDGATTSYSGTLSQIPILPNNVVFTSYDTNNEAVTLVDVPTQDPVTGVPFVLGDLVVPNSTTSVGSINYKTGVYSFTFPAAPASGAYIFSETVPYVAARSNALLYFDNKFTVRPVPDKAYPVQMEVYKRPTSLVDSSDIPEIEQWWQYIACGTAIKILTDRLDLETVQAIMPEFKRQERLVLRRTIVENTNQRTATIYSQQASIGAALNNYYNGFNGF